MKNLFRLAGVLIRGNGLASLGSDSSRHKKRSLFGSMILFGVLGVYLIAIMAGSAFTLYDLLAGAGLQSLLSSLYLNAAVMLVFFFGILYVISIFYYSSDVEKLLPLPLRPQEIIGAKLLVTGAYEYLFLAVLILPPLLVYGVRGQMGFVYYLSLFVDIVFLPVIPLCMASMLVILIMRFTPLARNKDRFNLISSLLAIVLALAFVFASQSMTSVDEQDLARMIQTGAGSVSGLTGVLFPGTSFAVGALEASSFLSAAGQLALLIVIAAAFLLVTLQLANLLYFKGVIGLNTSASGRHRSGSAELARTNRRTSSFFSYFLKDCRIMLRTPIFFMNNILMNFIWPVFLLIPLLAGDKQENLSELIPMARDALFSPDGAAPLALAICFAAFCFVAGSNGITESALSREGSVFYFMKIIPMSYNRQLMAKIAVGVFFSLLGALLPIIFFVAVLQPPFWFTLSVIAIVPGSILLPNLAGIIFELYWPKLKWDNEQKAVKQNLNVVYGILLAMLLAALVIAPVVIWQMKLLQSLLLIAVGPLVLSLILALLIKKIGPRRLLAIDA
ncbi:MAG: hypothetical protein VB070_08410 [Clostridiaceae bacterium]|nr:hypothetical protein [Clostridiaceae bacterium]